MKNFIKNMTYVLMSNIMTFILSTFITFIVPRKIGVENYGYFQLYIFYLGYIGFFHFGWVDGILLKYGGKYYNELEKNAISGQFLLFCLLELFMGVLVAIYGYFFVTSIKKFYVIICVGISIIMLLPRTFIQYILQATNRMREYAILLIVEKIFCCLCLIGIFYLNSNDFLLVIGADILGKAVATLYALYSCKNVVFCRPANISVSLREALDNISIGIKLMFANISSLLIIGVIRLSIEKNWNVATFGKISLTLSVSNLLMQVIRAISMSLFPTLRRMSRDNIFKLYHNIRETMMFVLFAMLIFYYPFKYILTIFLPQYKDSLEYMALLFPICIFESKMSMLIETYMKTLRMEKKLMLINFIMLGFSLVTTYICAFIFKNLNLTVLSIVFLLALRSIIAEIVLSMSENISCMKDIFYELIITVIFICSSWFIGGKCGFSIYLVAYIIYVYIYREKLVSIIKK